MRLRSAVGTVDATRIGGELLVTPQPPTAEAATFARFLEAVPDAVIAVDAAGKIRHANVAAAGLFLCAAGELLGQDLSVLMPAATRASHAEHVHRFVRAPARRAMGALLHLAARRRDGQEFPVEISLAPVVLDGEPLTLAALHDVSAHRAAERAGQLREQRLRTLTEMARIGSWSCAAAPHRCEVSPELAALLGLPEGAGCPASLDALAHPEDREALVGTVEAALADRQPFVVTVRLKHAAGEWRWFELRGAVEPEGGPGPPGVRGLAMDVTDRERAAEAERVAREQLVASDRLASVGLVAAGLAHEINNPLAAVLANLYSASDDLEALTGQVDTVALAELEDELRDAREAADRVREIVRDLKVFSRHEDERRVPVDVRRVLESSLRMAKNEIRHRARLVTELGEVPAVAATEARLGQVFLNLLVNAAQAIPEGRAGENEIRVTTRRGPAGEAVVEVRDTGGGIPPEHRARLFTPFFTTKPKGEGTGLGLMICQRIVASLDGAIEVEPAEGRGTVFRVRLPATAAARPAEEVPCAPRPVPARRGRVLVVDDDAMVGRAVVRALAAQHDAVVELDPRAALRRLAAGERFDVILCDVMMPAMGGAEFREALAREAPGLLDRLVYVTGGAFTEGARDFLARQPYPPLEKPFDPAALRAVVSHFLEGPPAPPAGPRT